MESSVKRPVGSRLLAAIAVVASLAIGGVFLLPHSSGANEGVGANDVISALTTTPTTTAPDEVTQVSAFSIADFSNLHELGRDLGRFHSTLFVAPGREGPSVCYILNPASGSKGVGTGYCHPLGDIPQTARDHYSVLTPGTSANGVFYTQLVGIVFDDVTAVRVRVDGTWRSVPIVGGNGFYLDVKGQPKQLKVELQDGSVQTRDFPAQPDFARISKSN
jgi:hypothetical protein